MRFSNGTPSLADCTLGFVGKDADTACKSSSSESGVCVCVCTHCVWCWLGLSEVAILVAAKSLLTTKLLLAVPVIGSM